MAPNDATARQTESSAGKAAPEKVEAYLKSQQDKGLLRFIICGSVGDGKSTLVGRLLYDYQLLLEDRLAQLDALEILYPSRIDHADDVAGPVEGHGEIHPVTASCF